jgi:hypothetical protein
MYGNDTETLGPSVRSPDVSLRDIRERAEPGFVTRT